jgi:hypothetical protein
MSTSFNTPTTTGLVNTNPVGSQYANTSAYSPQQIAALERPVYQTIYSAVKAKYIFLPLLYSKPVKYYPSDEFSFQEKTFSRQPLELAATVTAVAALPQGAVSAVFTFTPASMSRIAENLVIGDSNTNNQYIVRSVNTSTNQATVESATGKGISGINIATQNRFMFITNMMTADGRSTLNQAQRLKTIERTNYMGQFQRVRKWGQVELQKYKNTQKTNYIQTDSMAMAEELYIDLVATAWNGIKGEFRLGVSDPQVAKSTDGIYNIMLSAGAPIVTSSLSTLPAVFRALAFSSDFKPEGSTRMVFGTNEVLSALSSTFKDAGVRYAPNDTVSSMDLTRYKVGTENVVPVPMDIFETPGVFPAFFKTSLFVLDWDTISPTCMDGMQPIKVGSTLAKTGDNTSREGFQENWIEAMMGIEYVNPLGGFIIQVTGL